MASKIDRTALNSEVLPVSIESEMQSCYLDYSMSVNAGRALPELKDGMKHSQRRIIYAMHLEKMHPDTPYKKSARAVGSVTSSFHPHGTEAVYGTMVRMTQDFSLNVPLIDGQGNFGSIDGDPPAAMRYTEVRLTKISLEILKDLEYDTVPFRPNYDGLEMEPCVLPAKFPNILVNGSEGIGVGMATNIPPYNLVEILNGCIHMLDNPDATNEELQKIITGPDFPTAGTIMGLSGVSSIFSTGSGSFILRGKLEIEEGRIVATQIPYQVNKSRLIEKIAEKIQDKTIQGISEIRDESNREGIRIVLDLKRGVIEDLIIEQLYRYTQLQISYSAQLLMIHKGKPQTMSIPQVINSFLEFRQEVVERRIRFLLDKDRKRVHILIGLHLAVENISKVISLIRSSANGTEAKHKLLAERFSASQIEGFLDASQKVQIDSSGMYQLSFEQVKGILDMRLQQLTNLGKEDIEREMHTLFDQIEKYLKILADKNAIKQIIKDEMVEIKEKFPIERRTNISDASPEMDDLSLIPNEEVILTLSQVGYLKRVPLQVYRSQKRGGRGRTGMPQKDNDFLVKVITTETHSDVLLFSTHGRVYKIPVYKIPEGSPTSKGRPVQNLIPLAQDEKIREIFVIKGEEDKDNLCNLLFATEKGMIRKNSLSDFINVRRNGKTAIQLNPDDYLVSVKSVREAQNILIATRQGKCVRFQEEGVRLFSGCNTKGTRGIRLKENDSVVGMSTAWDDEIILSVTRLGYGKRTPISSYRKTQRGTQGVLNIRASEGEEVIFVEPVGQNDNVIIATNTGRVIKCPANQVRQVEGRITKGVKMFSLSNEHVTSVATQVLDEVIDETEDDQGNQELE